MKHCAKFSDAILPKAHRILADVAKLEAGATILDPFAGTGKGVEYLARFGYIALGIELEPNWAEVSERVAQGDALDLPWSAPSWDAIFTSPTYGNRMADVDMRDSVAGTYAKSLGRRASEGSSCHLQWGPEYRKFHESAWAEAKRVLKPHGWFLLNIKDHVRNKEVQPVSAWHVEALEGLGLTLHHSEFVPTPSQRRGANHDARTDGEWLHLLQKGPQ